MNLRIDQKEPGFPFGSTTQLWKTFRLILLSRMYLFSTADLFPTRVYRWFFSAAWLITIILAIVLLLPIFNMPDLRWKTIYCLSVCLLTCILGIKPKWLPAFVWTTKWLPMMMDMTIIRFINAVCSVFYTEDIRIPVSIPLLFILMFSVFHSHFPLSHNLSLHYFHNLRCLFYVSKLAAIKNRQITAVCTGRHVQKGDCIQYLSYLFL